MKNFKKQIFKITALTVITLFMGSSVFAQVQETQQDTTAQDTTMQSDQQQTLPQEQNQRTNQGFDATEPDKGVDYTETVDKSELPQEVNTSLDELYPAHEVTEVFKGDDDSYKVKVKNEGDEAFVYYNTEGNFLRAHNLTGLQQEGALPQNQSQRTQESQDQNQWGTDDDRTNQQGTTQGTQQQEDQEGTWGTDDTETQQETQGTQQENWGTDDNEKHQDTQGAQQETWGTDDNENNENTQGTEQENWGTDSETDEKGTQQQETWGTQSDTMNIEGSANPQEQNQRTSDYQSKNVDESVEYTETIEEGDLPQEVTSSLEELYPEHEIKEIMRGDDDSFKVKLKNQDDEAAVFYNSEGDFLKASNLNDMKEAASQEMNQRIENVEESQDADRWGTEQRMPEQEMQDDNMSSETDEVETNWGPEDQGAHQSTWEEDSVENTDAQESNQQGQWESENDTVQNEGTANPQEQNQRTNTTWDTEGDRSTESDFGADTENYTAPVDTLAAPQEQFQRGANDSDVDYSEEVQENDLPESITTSLDDLYPDHEIEEAYRGDDDSYKVKIKKDDENVAVFYDAEGQFNKEENMKDMSKDKHKDMHNDMHDDMQKDKNKDDNKDTNQDW